MTEVLVSGASGGIGRALCLLLAERGCFLQLWGRPSPAALQTAQLLTEKGTRYYSFDCDFAERSSVDGALEQVSTLRPVPDVLVLNAGIVERALVSEQSDALWDRHFEVNVTSPMRIVRHFLPGMLQRGSGRILFVSSISAVLGSRAQSAYNASKAAMVSLMRCLAEELSDSGLMTMALLPGSVDTRMLEGSGYPPRMMPEDVARTLLFYALDAPTAHNGAVVEMFGV